MRKEKEESAGVSKLAPELCSRDDLQHRDSIRNIARRLRRSAEGLLRKPMTLPKPMRNYNREPGAVVESERSGFRRATAATQQGRGTNSRQDSHDDKGTVHETVAGVIESLSLQLQGYASATTSGKHALEARSPDMNVLSQHPITRPASSEQPVCT